MGVGEAKPARARREQHDGLEHDPLDEWDLVIAAIVAVSAEAGTDDDVERFGAQTLDHRENVLDLVLAVRVEGDEVLRAWLGASVFNAGLDGRALPEIHRMLDEMRAGGVDRGRGIIGRAIVDGHDVGEGLSRAAEHVLDDRALVEAGHHEPHVAVARVALVVCVRNFARGNLAAHFGSILCQMRQKDAHRVQDCAHGHASLPRKGWGRADQQCATTEHA